MEATNFILQMNNKCLPNVITNYIRLKDPIKQSNLLSFHPLKAYHLALKILRLKCKRLGLSYEN